MDAVATLPAPVNEPILDYAPGSPERAGVEAALKELGTQTTELTMTIAGAQRMAGGASIDVVSPQRHAHVLGRTANATSADVQAAVDAARQAAPPWRELPFAERAAVFLRAADLLSGPWRPRLNAATMLGQSKTVIQAEIDSACELIDFLRFNVGFAHQILAGQPESARGVWNRSDYRPLEGFVLAITPFNFTAIAGNLPTAPALMGNTVVWKPSPTQQLSAHFTMRVLEAAGLPPGVINMVTGDGTAVSDVALTHRDLAGIHFTGSTPTFQHLWRSVGSAIDRYRCYPRLVGETGGKDFVIAHPDADADGLVTALVRGAFEFQGQKCSAASRAYVPRSLWDTVVRDQLADTTQSLSYGDPADFTNFGGAVIDRRAFDRLSGVLDMAATDPALAVLAGGSADGSEGFFVRPTVVTSDDPTHEVFTKEYFGPFLAVHVYDDADYHAVVDQAADIAPYALTGSIFATDRRVIDDALHRLRFSAGNFYINDKPTGAVVGQQPFGGARASGTNDKAGSPLNLLRWVSPRTVKETFVPATDHRYPHMADAYASDGSYVRMLRPGSWIRPAGVSPVPVGTGAPGSRPRFVVERWRAERGVESLFGGSKRAGRSLKRTLQPRHIHSGRAEPLMSRRRPCLSSPVPGSVRRVSPGYGRWHARTVWFGTGETRLRRPDVGRETGRISRW